MYLTAPPEGRAQTKTPWSSRLGVGHEANNFTPEKNSIIQEFNRGKNWSDLLERHGRGKGLGGYMHTEETTGRWS